MSISLPHTIGLSETAELSTLLRDRISCAEPLVLDGSKVDRIGLAGLQVLLAAQACAITAGLDFQLQSSSEALAKMVKLACLDDLLVS